MARSGGDRISTTGLSVLISSWNNSRRLAVTLDSISRCLIPPGLEWELVLVNNNCTDDTNWVVREFADTLPIVYVHERRPGLSRGRNAGLKAASGQLIIFTDDDVKPCREWITIYWTAYVERPTGFYFGGPIRSEFEIPNPDEELMRLAPLSIRGLNYGQQPRKLAKHEYFIGPNWACPADPVRAIGGFDINKSLDPSLGRVRIGGETDLMRRLDKTGLSPWYLPGALVVHFVAAHKSTLKHVAARKEAHGVDRAIDYLDGRPVQAICRIPLWLYREALALLVKWIWGKLLGERGYREYITLRHRIGIMKGLRELKTSIPAADSKSEGCQF